MKVNVPHGKIVLDNNRRISKVAANISIGVPMRKAYTTLPLFLAFLFVTNCYAKLPASFNNNGTYDLLRVTTPAGVRVKLKQATIGEGAIISDLGN